MARREITGRKPGITADLIERKSGSPEHDDDELDDEADDDSADDEPSQHDELAVEAPATRPRIRGPPRRLAPRTTVKTRPKVAVFDEADAYSIEEFCRRHRLSLQMFYKRPDLMPDTFNVGKRRLISREAAARWRAEREAATAAQPS